MGVKMKFSGEYNISIDPKGRISIPASFRDELRDDYNAESLVVTKFKKGLVAYPPQRWNEIRAKVLAMPVGPTREAYLRNRVAPAKECDFNAQGRIQIPQSLREHAGLDKEVIVVGMFEKIEIWSQQAHLQVTAESEDLLGDDAQGQANLGF
jgi:MraZ protein